MKHELRLMRKERIKIEKTKALLKYNSELAIAYRKSITAAWQGKNFAVVGIYGKLLCGVRHNIRACQFSLSEGKKRIRELNRSYDNSIKC